MGKPAFCKNCGEEGHWKSFCWRTAKTTPIAKKRPKPIGKVTAKYIEWRNTVAVPYLDKTFGRTCKNCGAGGKLDVAHFQSRGSNPGLRMSLHNVHYLCRKCHQKEHGINL